MSQEILISPFNDYGATNKLKPNSFSKSDECDDVKFELEETEKDRPTVKEKYGHYFTDGIRQIDFILAYEEGLNTEEGKDPVLRKTFEKRLIEAGLELEEESTEGNKASTIFVKIHINFALLCRYAEEQGFKAPLQVVPNPTSNFSAKCLSIIKLPNFMIEEPSSKPLNYYTCAFKRNKLTKYLGSDHSESFFGNRHRSRIVYEILQSTVYGKRKRGEIGIERLLEEGIYKAAFPLHDGPSEASKTPEALSNPRQVLRAHWAAWSKWYKYQPLDNVRDYFGEKIGLYFAWLGFYTAWLLPASIVGVLVFSYGIATMYRYTPANTICSSGEEFLMCPLCEVSAGCSSWFLNTTCGFVRASYLFDHGGTVFYAVFMSFWAVCFLENWKRKQASLAYHWDCFGYEEEEERPRPEFTAKAPTFEKNPVTGAMEPSFPKSMRIPRLLTSVSAVVMMVVVVVIFIVAVIVYRTLIRGMLYANRDLQSYASPMTSISAAIFNLILIMVLSKVYEALAKLLTDWEMHRTNTDYEDNLTLKVFVFQFCNIYSSIVYIGFFKGRFVGYPGHYTKILGIRNEDCNTGGCLIELAQQLAVIMIGKQIIGNVQEMLLPKLKGYFRRKSVKSRMDKDQDLTPWERDYQLVGYEGLFQEYLEMVIQFGFITIFVAAFPLAPLFALLNNWVEIRLDAGKLVTETRRPIAQKAEDIGIWFDVLEYLAKLAVIANAFLIAFTSTFLDELVYSYTTEDYDLVGYVNHTLAVSLNNSDAGQTCRYSGYRDENGETTTFYWRMLAAKLGFVIIFEHVVFFVGRMIDIMVPDIPEVLQLKVKRENYLAKQALAEVGIKGEDDDI